MAQVYLYDFTLASDKNVLSDVREFCKDNSSRWVFQKEKGTGENGYEHYQCRVSLNKKLRIENMLQLMRKHGLKVSGAAVSQTSKNCAENTFATFNYVMKEDTRIAGPWDDKQDRKVKTRSVQWIDDNGTLPWQETMIDMIKLYNHRNIDILWDKRGNLGKSVFADWMEFYDHAIECSLEEDVKEMKHFVYQHAHAKCYIFDTERALDKKDQRRFWAFIEQLKNGKVSDNRYKNKRIKMERPHIWVFTNWIPESYMQSPDRYRYWTVEDNELERYYPEDACAAELN